VIAAFARIIRQVPGVTGASVAALTGVSQLAHVHPLATWLPTQLASAEGGLAQQDLSAPWHAIAVTALSALIALAFALPRTSPVTPSRRVPAARMGV
jgi:hypothetical protein